MKADANSLAYIGSKPGTSRALKRESDSWYTPERYTEMVRDVMGDIDLDPYSSAFANQRVRAKKFFGGFRNLCG